MTFLRTLRRRLTAEQGSSLPEVMVAVLVSSAALGVIAGGIVALTSLFSQTSAASASINESTTAAMRWRTDVHNAVAITPQDDKTVVFTVPAASGGCVQSKWVSVTASLTVTTTSYPTLSGTACSGTAGTPTKELIMRSGAAAKFSYQNPAGRVITYSAGAATLAGGTKDPATAQATWDAKTVTAATLDATPTFTTPTPRTIHSVQVATTILTAGSGTSASATTTVTSTSLLQNPLTATKVGTGTASHVEGASPATATVNAPRDIVVDSAGNTFILDTGNNAIRKVDTAGTVTTYAGSATNVAGATNGTGTAALFKSPQGIALGADGTTLFIADTGNNKIRKVAAGGVVTDYAGNGTATFADNATGTSASFNAPQGVAVSAAGVVYVGDTGNNRIRAIAASAPNAVTTFAGTGSAGAVNGTGTTSATFNGISGIALDNAGANLYVTETTNNDIRQIVVASAAVTTLAGGTAGYGDGSGAAAKFTGPKDVTVGVDGVLYVADTGNNRIRAVTTGGVVTTIAGSGIAGAAEGSKAGSQFNAPAGIRALANGSLLVADTGSNKVRSIR